MIKVIVDSASSIKPCEKEKYDVDIIPLQVTFGDKTYYDGEDLTMDEFYDHLINKKEYPKTSLPSFGKTKEIVQKYLDKGDKVIILTVSSKMSGTYNSIRLLFEDNPDVLVIDSGHIVGGMRLLVEEINKIKHLTFDEIHTFIDAFVPRIKTFAIPETLTYLLKGGRLSRGGFLIATALSIKPIISIVDGNVKAIAKKRGFRSANNFLINCLEEFDCDPSYSIIPSYTYDPTNLKEIIKSVDPKYQKAMTEFDNLAPAVASHWGPGAYGFIFVSKKDSTK